MTRRFLAIVAAVALSLAWMPATAAAGEPGAGDWPQFHGNPSHTGYNPAEHTISAANVVNLRPVWIAYAVTGIGSSPAVANGVVYVATDEHNLSAYAAGCSSGGGTCTPLWTATIGITSSSPAVANGVVYVGSEEGELYAYAAGCRPAIGETCHPLWTTPTGGIDSSPAVANGVVYVGSRDRKLYAYAVGCASGGGTCTPLWTATTGGYIESSPAVANGVVYVGSSDRSLYAFSLSGVTPPATSTVASQPLSETGASTLTLALGLAAFLLGTLLTVSRSRTGDSRKSTTSGSARGSGSLPV
jgi:outer membrane protein assembly factor BamB